MRSKEIIREATIDPDIKDILFGKGHCRQKYNQCNQYYGGKYFGNDG